MVKKYLPFKYKAGVDGLAFKGCLYSKIKLKPGKFLHLFNIHSQASYSTEYTAEQHEHFQARLNQLLLCQEFIRYCLVNYSNLEEIEKKHLNDPECQEKWLDYVLIGGDMNVDARGKPIPCNFRLHNENAAKFVGLHHNYCGVNLSHSLRLSKTG